MLTALKRMTGEQVAERVVFTVLSLEISFQTTNTLQFPLCQLHPFCLQMASTTVCLGLRRLQAH